MSIEDQNSRPVKDDIHWNRAPSKQTLLRVLPMVAMVAITLSGCMDRGFTESDSSKDQNHDTPIDDDLALLEAAIEQMQTRVDDQIDIRLVNMSLYSFGYKGSTRLEFGANEVVSFHYSFAHMAMTQYCSPDRTAVIQGGTVYDYRLPDLDGCSLFQDDPEEDNPQRSVEEVRRTATGGWLFIGHESWNNEEGDATWELDSTGRLIRWDYDSRSDSWSTTIDYGERTDIEMPEANQQLSATINEKTHVEYNETGIQTGYTWAHAGGDEGLPLGDFEVRVGKEAWGDWKGYSDLYVTFDFTEPLQNEDGFTYRYRGNGNGVLDAEDGFSVRNADWNTEDEFIAVVWDRIVDAPVNYTPWCRGGGC